MFKQVKTKRGFSHISFLDSYGVKCSIQKSSNISVDSIWIGVDNAEPKLLASDARKFGIKTRQEFGWVSYPIPEDVLLTTRMHLTREQVAELLPILQKFVETGGIDK